MPLTSCGSEERRDGRARPSDRDGAPREAGPAGGVPFDGLTEEWRLVGRMEHRRAAFRRAEQARGDRRSTTSSGRRSTAPGRSPRRPGCKTVDPYDLILVLAGDDTLPDADRGGAGRPPGPQGLLRRRPRGAAVPGHRDRLPVPGLRAGPAARPGDRDVRPGHRRPSLLGDEAVAEDIDTVLVNRFYLRGVEQIDKRTGRTPQKLPGAPLGGISWQDRS